MTAVQSAVKPFRNGRANATDPRDPATDTDLELGGLTLKIPSGQAPDQQVDTGRPKPGTVLSANPERVGFDAVSAAVATPSSPDRPTEALWTRAKWCWPRLQRGCRASMAWRSFGARDATDLLIGRDLLGQLGQNSGVTHIAGGELGRPDLQRFLANSLSRRRWQSPAGQRIVSAPRRLSASCDNAASARSRHIAAAA